MKKIVLLIATLGMFSMGYSQKLRDAKKSLKEAQDLLVLKNEGDAVKKLTEAKTVIETLLQDPKNAKDAETWYYKAAIYMLMQEVPQFSSTGPYKVAYESLDKAISLNKKKTLEIEGAKNLILNNGFYAYNDGIQNLNTNKYKEATTNFAATYDLLNMDNGATFKEMKQIDTIKASALMLGGNAAYYGEDYAAAVKSLELAMSNPIVANESSIYLNLANSYGKLNQKDKQIATIEKGKKIFPKDGNIIAAEINYYIDNNQVETVIAKLENEIKANPEKDDYYYNLGLTYLQLVEKYKETPEELNYWQKAFDNFGKARKLKAENVEYNYVEATAAFNMGAIYNNQMVTSKNEAEIAKLQKQRDQSFRAAIPGFEMFNKSNKSKDISKMTNTQKSNWERALRALSNIYANLDMMEQYNAIKSQLSKI